MTLKNSHYEYISFVIQFHLDETLFSTMHKNEREKVSGGMKGENIYTLITYTLNIRW